MGGQVGSWSQSIFLRGFGIVRAVLQLWPNAARARAWDQQRPLAAAFRWRHGPRRLAVAARRQEGERQRRQRSVFSFSLQVSVDTTKSAQESSCPPALARRHGAVAAANPPGGFVPSAATALGRLRLAGRCFLSARPLRLPTLDGRGRPVDFPGFSFRPFWRRRNSCSGSRIARKIILKN